MTLNGSHGTDGRAEWRGNGRDGGHESGLSQRLGGAGARAQKIGQWVMHALGNIACRGRQFECLWPAIYMKRSY